VTELASEQANDPDLKAACTTESDDGKRNSSVNKEIGRDSNGR